MLKASAFLEIFWIGFEAKLEIKLPLIKVKLEIIYKPLGNFSGNLNTAPPPSLVNSPYNKNLFVWSMDNYPLP